MQNSKKFTKKQKWAIEILIEKYSQKENKINLKIEIDENNFVYQDDEGEKYFGLKKDYFFEIENKKIFIFDNHNKAILKIIENLNEAPETVIHIDAHPDDAIFQYPYPQKLNSKNYQEFYQKSRVSDYIDLLEKTKIIKKTYRYCQSWEFENFKLPDEKYILNLDIDIFGFDGQVVDLETKIKTIVETWRNSDFILIATSPGFIDQEDAKFLIELFLNKM